MFTDLRISRALILGSLFLMLTSPAAKAGQPLIYISAFTSGEQGAIHAFELDTEAGQLKPLHRDDTLENPFFIAVTPDHQYLYSIFAPTFGGKESEQVAAFKIDQTTGKLSPLGRQSSKGTASCFLEVDPTGKSVVLANYSSGNVASYAVQKDGSLSEPVSFVQHEGSSVNTKRQGEPHAHGFAIAPNNRFAYAADLGIDKVLCYAFDPETAELTPNSQPFVRTPPGAGPRHLTFHPNGKHLYVINELLNTITSYDFIADSGMLVERQTIATLPENFSGVSNTADVKITPDGRYLYGTNRGHDSIAAYRIAEDGQLSLIEIAPSLGKGPQNLAITGDGSLLICANMPGDNVVVFRIDPATGKLTAASDPIEMPRPSCVRIIER